MLVGDLNLYLLTNIRLQACLLCIKVAQLSVLGRCRRPHTYPHSRCRWGGGVVHPFDLIEPLSNTSTSVLLDLAILHLSFVNHPSPNHELLIRYPPYISSFSELSSSFPSPACSPSASGLLPRWHAPRYRLRYLQLPLQKHRAPAVDHRNIILVAFLVRRHKTLWQCSFHACVHQSTPRA